MFIPVALFLVPLLSSCLPLWANSVPLEMVNGYPVVQVSINGAGPFSFLIDTGSDSTVGTDEVIRAAQIRFTYRVELITSGHSKIVPAGVADSVEFAGVRIHGAEILCHGMPATQWVGRHIQGILGQNVLSNFDYLLDLRNQRLIVADEARRKAVDLAGQHQPIERIGRRMAVTARTAGNRSPELRLILDSGASHLFLHDGKRLNGVSIARSSRFDMQLLGNAGARLATSGLLRHLEVGGQRLANVAVALMPETTGLQRPEDGLLPLNLFSALYVSNTENYVILTH